MAIKPDSARDSESPRALRKCQWHRQAKNCKKAYVLLTTPSRRASSSNMEARQRHRRVSISIPESRPSPSRADPGRTSRPSRSGRRYGRPETSYGNTGQGGGPPPKLHRPLESCGPTGAPLTFRVSLTWKMLPVAVFAIDNDWIDGRSHTFFIVDPLVAQALAGLHATRRLTQRSLTCQLSRRA
jgi:hypothetical protein